jgi:RsiW-degrading membrane proteinase PrsW (M82 family)
MSFMRVDAELTGVFVAIGFALMLAVALPITKWFVLGTVLLGALIAIGIRLVRSIRRS